MSLSPKDKIDILLKEYDTLRSEIINRIWSRFIVTGLLFAVVPLVSDKAGAPPLLSLMSLGVVLTGMWWLVSRGIQSCGRRLCELEQQINTLAGDKLLQWETKLRKDVTSPRNPTS
jgi:hypothetical protein